MKNTNELKKLISQSINQCEDFALQDVKRYLYMARNLVEEVDKKRNRRDTTQKMLEEQETKKTFISADVLNELDKLIALEKNKLENLKNKAQEEDETQFLID